jgi:hypothetical protein
MRKTLNPKPSLQKQHPPATDGSAGCGTTALKRKGHCDDANDDDGGDGGGSGGDDDADDADDADDDDADDADGSGDDADDGGERTATIPCNAATAT